MKTIAITGPIGSGKTFFGNFIKKHGFICYSTDKIAHQILETKSVRQRVVDEFGETVVVNGKIKRDKLAKIVFKSQKSISLLNSITHPIIFEKMAKLKRETEAEFLFFEIPLIDSFLDWFDFCIVVSAKKSNRIKRVEKRKKYSKKVIKSIVALQPSEKNYHSIGDIVFFNDCSTKDFACEIDKFLMNIKQLVDFDGKI